MLLIIWARNGNFFQKCTEKPLTAWTTLFDVFIHAPPRLLPPPSLRMSQIVQFSNYASFSWGNPHNPTTKATICCDVVKYTSVILLKTPRVPFRIQTWLQFQSSTVHYNQAYDIEIPYNNSTLQKIV